MNELEQKINELAKLISDELGSRGIKDYADFAFMNGKVNHIYSGGTVHFGVAEYIDWVESHVTIEENRIRIANHHHNMQKRIEAMEW